MRRTPLNSRDTMLDDESPSEFDLLERIEMDLCRIWSYAKDQFFGWVADTTLTSCWPHLDRPFAIKIDRQDVLGWS